VLDTNIPIIEIKEKKVKMNDDNVVKSKGTVMIHVTKGRMTSDEIIT
jgi:hypothetical protein